MREKEEKKTKKDKCRKLHAGKFFFGWFVGMIFTIALFAGVGFWFYKCGSISTVEKLLNIEISALNDDIKNTPVEILIGKISNVAFNYNDMSIEELADEVGLALDKTLTITGTGASRTYHFKTLNITNVIKGKLEDIGKNFQDVVDTMSLADIEGSFNVTLPDIELLNSVKSSPIKDLNTSMQNAFETYTLNKISNDFNVSFADADMLNTLLDVPINQLASKIQELKVKDVFDISQPGTSKVLIALQDVAVTSLASEIGALHIEDILTVSGNKFLEALQTSTLDSLNQDIKNLKVNQIVNTSSSKFLQALANSPILSLESAVDNLLVTDLFEIPTSGSKGVWAFIDNVDTLKLNELDTAIDNLDLSSETLGDLQTHGLISSSIILTKPLKNSGNAKTLAEYTISELIEAITEV